MIQADILRDREEIFAYDGERYRAKFRKQNGWTIFDNRGVYVGKKTHPKVWEFFRENIQPPETKSDLIPQ